MGFFIEITVKNKNKLIYWTLLIALSSLVHFSLTIIISIIITVLGVTILPNVIDWIFPKFIDAKDAIQIMSLGIIPATISILYSSKFLGMEKSKFVMITKLVSLGILIGGFLYFGPIYGTVGLAWVIVTALTWESIFLFIMNRTLKAS